MAKSHEEFLKSVNLSESEFRKISEMRLVISISQKLKIESRWSFDNLVSAVSDDLKVQNDKLGDAKLDDIRFARRIERMKESLGRLRKPIGENLFDLAIREFPYAFLKGESFVAGLQSWAVEAREQRKISYKEGFPVRDVDADVFFSQWKSLFSVLNDINLPLFDKIQDFEKEQEKRRIIKNRSEEKVLKKSDVAFRVPSLEVLDSPKERDKWAFKISSPAFSKSGGKRFDLFKSDSSDDEKSDEIKSDSAPQISVNQMASPDEIARLTVSSPANLSPNVDENRRLHRKSGGFIGLVGSNKSPENAERTKQLSRSNGVKF